MIGLGWAEAPSLLVLAVAGVPLSLEEEFDTIVREKSGPKLLSRGVVDGCNIGRDDFATTLPLPAKTAVSAESTSLFSP